MNRSRLSQSARLAAGSILAVWAMAAGNAVAEAQLAVRGETVHTVGKGSIAHGVVLIGTDGKITAVGPADAVAIPPGVRVLTAKVVTPGLIDAHSTVGMSGVLNQPHDQDQVETSTPIQPELRAIDAYNARDPLIAYLREFGITTVHTGHGPLALVSGDTLIAKTRGDEAEAAVIVPHAMIAARLGEGVKAAEGKSPGTRSKAIALLRAELLKAREYLDKKNRATGAAPATGDAGAKPAKPKPGEKKADAPSPPDTNLRSEALLGVLEGKVPLLVTVHRANDIVAALRLIDEFKLRAVLDGVSEAPLVLDRIRASGLPVIVHPTMMRHGGETENASFETAAKLREAGIAVALQSGYEGYVPKTRVVLFEAAVAAANGLGFDGALRTVTLDAAKILGIDGRVGSLEVGKDGDVALYDGDPFETTSHCTGVVIEGQVVSEGSR
jgi:imidazolonepropionase-like amidohydrolase